MGFTGFGSGLTAATTSLCRNKRLVPCYNQPMTAKVCPRCGCQYENFKSTTCPQCFAILVAVDEATAGELAAARAEVERSDEFKETKLADDERFRQQSFGACLGIAGLTLVTLIVAVVLLVSAAHRKTVSAARRRRRTARRR